MGTSEESRAKQARRHRDITTAARTLVDEVERRFGLEYVDGITAGRNTIIVHFCDGSDATLAGGGETVNS